MSKQEIGRIIDTMMTGDEMMETGIEGVKLFRVTRSVPCAPAVYEPSLVAIVSGSKEAIFDGARHIYDNSQYMCCSISMPLEAGTPCTSPDDPLLGVYISLNTKVMTELAIELETIPGVLPVPKDAGNAHGLVMAEWDDVFTEALLRLVRLAQSPADAAILGHARLREVYYAVFKGAAGPAARHAFGAGNQIARIIEFMSARLNAPVSIDDMAAQAGMSRAVFHRKFKQATTMSPIQFVKSMRLNNAATKIAGGMTVNEAALAVGYVSSSQFNREFKRLYGQSPKQWSYSAGMHAVEG